MLVSATILPRHEQDLPQPAQPPRQQRVGPEGGLDGDEAGCVCAAATPPRHASGAARRAPTQLASSSSSTHGSETLGVVLHVSLARVLHVCVERGRGALRARDYRSTLGKQTLYGALETAHRASGGERHRPRRHRGKATRVMSAVRFASEAQTVLGISVSSTWATCGAVAVGRR